MYDLSEVAPIERGSISMGNKDRRGKWHIWIVSANNQDIGTCWVESSRGSKAVW